MDAKPMSIDIKKSSVEDMIKNVNVARLCGPHRSKCGYCSGDRAPLLDQHLGQLGYDTDGDDYHHEQESSSSSPSASEEGQDSGDHVVMEEDRSVNVNAEESSSESSSPAHEKSNNSNKKINSKIPTTQSPHSRFQYNANNSSKSYGVLFDKLTCNDYLQLMNHGWRRSGHHLYLPENWVSCCPAIPIRLRVDMFQMSKSQRKVWKRFEKSLSCSCSSSSPNETANGNGAVPLGGEAKRLKAVSTMEQPKKTHTKKKSFISQQQKTKSQPELDDHFLSILQQAIVQSVRMSCDDATLSSVLLIEHENGSSNNQISQDALRNQLLKLSLPKLKLRKQKPNSNSNSNPSTTICYVTTVCCAIAGRSRGSIQVQTLAEQVASKLQQSLSKSSSLQYEHAQQPTQYPDSIFISSVEVLPSGHIAMSIDISSATAMTTTSSMDQHTDFLNNGSNNPCKNHHKEQQQGQDVILVDHLAEALKLKNTNKPHKLTVRSLPLEVSKAMPEVHRLFAQYQEAIHGDVNPYHAMDELARAEAVQYSEHEQFSSSSNNRSSSHNNSNTLLGDRLRSMRHGRKSAERKLRDARLSFERFLCESPLSSESSSSSRHVNLGGSSSFTFRPDDEGYDVRIPLGSYHQQYRIDGVLIAVGVIDVLPTGISSVYSFYDPELSGGKLNFNLGKFTALREIEWVRRASKYRPNLKYYYLGFYIHSCQKMRYKAEYKPSELLCPVSKSWIKYEQANDYLDKCTTHDYCSFVDRSETSIYNTNDITRQQQPLSSGANESPAVVKRAIDSLRLEIGSVNDDTGEMPTRLTMQMLSSHGKAIVGPLLTEFVEKIGTDICQRSIIKLQ